MKRSVDEATRVKKVAQITGKNRRTIKRVINGDYDNDEIMNTYMFLLENENRVFETTKKRFLRGAFSVN